MRSSATRNSSSQGPAASPTLNSKCPRWTGREASNCATSQVSTWPAIGTANRQLLFLLVEQGQLFAETFNSSLTSSSSAVRWRY